MSKKFELSDIDKDILNDSIITTICSVFKESIENDIDNLYKDVIVKVMNTTHKVIFEDGV